MFAVCCLIVAGGNALCVVRGSLHGVGWLLRVVCCVLVVVRCLVVVVRL